MTGCSIFSTVQSFWLDYGLLIGVTHSYSSRPFLCTPHPWIVTSLRVTINKQQSKINSSCGVWLRSISKTLEGWCASDLHKHGVTFQVYSWLHQELVRVCWKGKIGVVCGREHTSLINEPQLPPPKGRPSCGFGLVPRLAEMLYEATHCAGCYQVSSAVQRMGTAITCKIVRWLAFSKRHLEGSSSRKRLTWNARAKRANRCQLCHEKNHFQILGDCLAFQG